MQAFELRENERFSYAYDMGDHWEHEVRIEAIAAADPKKFYPTCIGGSEACLVFQGFRQISSALSDLKNVSTMDLS